MKRLLVIALILALAGVATAATDGAYTKTSPNYGTENAQNAFDEIKENFVWLERHILMGERFTGLTGYCATYTYAGGNLTTITVYNATGTPPNCSGSVQATGAFTYSGGNLSTEAWTINGKVLTYTYSYSGSDLVRVSLAITTP